MSTGVHKVKLGWIYYWDLCPIYDSGPSFWGRRQNRKLKKTTQQWRIPKMVANDVHMLLYC